MAIFHPPAQRHSDTSLAAADAIRPHAGTKRYAVLNFLLHCGTSGATDEEQQHCLQMNASTQRPRRIELVQAGLVTKSSQRRRTSSGRHAVVWVVTPRALNV